MSRMGEKMLVELLEPDPILLDDPVRPNISPVSKVNSERFVCMWLEDGKIAAVVCFAFRYGIPRNERELLQAESNDDCGLKMILYSIWSYKKGCGSKLLFALIKRHSWNRIITMSPKTDMVRNFHLGNGATVLRTNRTTVNYEY